MVANLKWLQSADKKGKASTFLTAFIESSIVASICCNVPSVEF